MSVRKKFEVKRFRIVSRQVVQVCLDDLAYALVIRNNDLRLSEGLGVTARQGMSESRSFNSMAW